jgi:catechol 2,3-dioxygenase
MQLTWSHAVLNIKDEPKMLDFYTKTLGFSISDRGPIAEKGPDIIFLSQTHDEHHQLAFVTTRKDEAPSNSLNHIAFRVKSFENLKTLKTRLEGLEQQFLPLSHGNTLSFYFSDPEGNGLEVFWDTPWHVSQPAGVVWDSNLDEAAALAWVKETFEQDAEFSPREDAKGAFVNRTP